MSKSNLIRFSGVFWFISLALVLPGCWTTAKNIKGTSELNQVGKDSSIVFGRIQWIENGEEKKIGTRPIGKSLLPLLIKMKDKPSKTSTFFYIRAEISKGGNFVWSLKAGRYLFWQMTYQSTWGLQYVLPNITFSVPENGKVYYVGVVRFEYEKKSGKVKVTIQDEGDRDLVEFQDKFSIPSEDIKKLLMIFR